MDKFHLHAVCLVKGRIADGFGSLLKLIALPKMTKQGQYHTLFLFRPQQRWVLLHIALAQLSPNLNFPRDSFTKYSNWLNACLGMKSGDDELGGIGGVIRLAGQHLGHCRPIGRVQGCVNLVK